MFWSSLLHGCVVLSHWQVLIGILVFSLLNWGFKALVAGQSPSTDVRGKVSAGWIIGLGHVLFCAVMIGVFVLVLLPIPLGRNYLLPLRFIPEIAWPATVGALIGFVAVVLLSFLPVVGDIVAGSTGIQIMIIGALVFRRTAPSLILTMSGGTVDPKTLYPGFWASSGYIVISFIVVYGVLTLLATIGRFVSRSEERGKAIARLLALFVSPLLGTLCLFMYISYVRLGLEAALK